MNVICDTNIWYYLADGTIKINPSGLNLTMTYINLDEVASSHNLLDNIEKSRGAIREMMKAESRYMIPPLYFIARIFNSTVKYDIRKEMPELLSATEKIAQGQSVLPENRKFIAQWIMAQKKPHEEFANFTMEHVKRIRPLIKDKKAHRKKAAIEGYRKLICSWVKEIIKVEIDIEKMDWSELELFEKTWMAFFLELELSDMEFTPNDFFDLFNLVYVSKRDQYFTFDKKVKNNIKRAGLGHYLFGDK